MKRTITAVHLWKGKKPRGYWKSMLLEFIFNDSIFGLELIVPQPGFRESRIIQTTVNQVLRRLRIFNMTTLREDDRVWVLKINTKRK